MTDDYCHADAGLVYISSSVPGAGCDLSLFESSPAGCECGHTCSLTCPHYFRFSHVSESSESLLVECNDNCSCDSDCSNRVVQRGPHPGLDVVDREGKGRGVVALETVDPGEFVCEYAGEVIGDKEAGDRWRRQEQEKLSNYILVVRELAGDRLVQRTNIDPTVIGNIGRYLNHSCDPNLSMMTIRSNTMIPQVAFFANRVIDPGEELCYDYGHSDDKTGSTKCLCSSSNCRGFIPFNPDLG